MNKFALVTSAVLSVALAGCTFEPAQPAPAVVTPAPQAQPVQPAPATSAPATSATPAPVPGRIIIENNKGGNVVQMMAYRSQLANSGQTVEIRGVCNSACTMLTTLPNACLAPNASIGFHAPRLPGTTVIPPIVDQLMATTYRNGIRARWYNEWRHSLEIRSITAREYVALDPMTKLCTS